MPAIVMGALLTGALFYVAAAGDAIIFRTQLQDAADTTAFTSAVWHAKGMNIIAVINILMSLLLCVIVLFHVLEVICLVVALIPGVGAIAMGVFRTLVQFETNAARGIKPALQVLSVTQKGVNVVVPYIAAFDAKRQPTAAETVWPMSLALLPTPVDTLLGQQMRMPEFAPAALPVTEDDFGVLCARATAVIPEQIMELIEKFGDKAPWPIDSLLKDGLMGTWNAIKDPINTLAEAGDGLLCQPVNNIIARFAEIVAGTVSSTVASDACGQASDDRAEEQRQQAANTPNPDGTPRTPPPPPTEAERRQDRRRRQGEIDGCASGVTGDLSRGTDISVPPAMVWEAASNGNVFMHTWSRVSGTPRLLSGDMRLISLAGNGAAPQVRPSTVAVAMAEYYVDCEGVWSECQEDAMWAPNWTARMRRFRWPQEELEKIGKETVLNGGTVLQDVAFEQGEEALGNLIGRATGDWAGEVISELVISKVREWEYLDTLVDKANQAIADGVEAAGLSEMLEIRDEEDKRIH